MKNATNNEQLAPRGFHMPELEKHILDIHEKCKEEALRNAHVLAIRGRPGLTESDISPYTYWITEEYDQLQAFATTAIQAANEKEFGKYDVQLSENSKTALEESLKDVSVDLYNKNTEAAKIEIQFPWRKYEWRQMVVGGIAGIETLFSSKAFQLFGDAIIFSILIACALGIALWAAAHTAPRIIRIGKTLVQRALISVLIFTASAFFFFAIGILRTKYLEVTGAITISPIFFTIINLFLFTTAVSYAYFFLPTKKDETDKEHLNRLQNQITRLEREKEVLEATQNNIPVSLGMALRSRLGRMTYILDIKEWIKCLSQQTIGVFVKENIEHRKDGVTPPCFRNLDRGSSKLIA